MVDYNAYMPWSKVGEGLAAVFIALNTYTIIRIPNREYYLCLRRFGGFD